MKDINLNSAYAVGASFTLENLVSPELKKISADMAKVDAQIETTKRNFQTLVPPSLLKRIESVVGSFNLLGPAADKAALAMVGAMGKAETGVMKAATGINGELDAAFADADAVANKAANGMIAAMKRAELASKGSADAIQLGFSGAFTGMDSGVVTAADTITGQFSRITRSAGRSSKAVANMRREIAALSALSSAPMPQLPSGAGGMRPRSGHRGGLGHSGGSSLSLGTSGHREIAGARVHGSGGGMAGLIGAGLIADGVYEAAELEDIVTKVLITSQMNPGEQPLTRNKDGGKIADLIKRGATISGASIKDVGTMFLSTEREFQGFDFDKKISTMQLMLPSIAAEAKLREESLEEAGKSLIGVLHQAGLVEPADMVKGAKEFQFTTMATPVGLEQFKGALSYAMPLHNQIGMDTGTIMLMTSLMQSSGITDTKSGTWLDALFTKAAPETDVLGPLKKEQIQHNSALKMLGLIGDDGKQNWHVMGADGKEDWNASALKFSQSLHDNQEKIPENERMDVLHRAFGTQGARAASLFSQQNIFEQFRILKEKEEAFKGGDATLSEYNNASTIQRARIAEQEFQIAMATLGTQILPTVNFALKGFSDALTALPNDWEATKKMWGDRLHFLMHPFGGSNGPDLGPMPAPKTDQGYLMGPGFQLNAYHEGSIGGVSDAEETIYRGTLRAFTDFAAGKSIAGGSGGGGGFMNASWEGGSFGFGGGGGGGGAANLRYGPGGHSRAADLSGGAATGEHADFIRAMAAKYGIDPAVAVAVANSEGLHSFVGDRGSSFGDFQLHYGGMAGGGMAGGGLGDDFTRETGLDARNPANWKAADEWALKRAAKGGWGPWHGAARIGVHGMAGIGGRPTGAFTGGGDGDFPGLTGNDPVGLALSMQHLGIGQTGSALGRLMHNDAWCADFVNGVLAKSGGRGTENALARSFAGWGKAVGLGDIQRNDVAVLNGGHHVGLFTGERDANGRLGVVAGNTRDGRGGHDVEHYFVSPGSVFAARRGAAAGVRAAPKQPDVHHVYTTVSLDGKQIGKSVVKTLGKSMRYPTSIGQADGHSFHVSPGTPKMDSA